MIHNLTVYNIIAGIHPHKWAGECTCGWIKTGPNKTAIQIAFATHDLDEPIKAEGPTHITRDPDA